MRHQPPYGSCIRLGLPILIPPSSLRWLTRCTICCPCWPPVPQELSRAMVTQPSDRSHEPQSEQHEKHHPSAASSASEHIYTTYGHPSELVLENVNSLAQVHCSSIRRQRDNLLKSVKILKASSVHSALSGTASNSRNYSDLNDNGQLQLKCYFSITIHSL